MVKFSIIVPIYQGEKTLKRCVESILNQSYRDFELILVNDGSGDRSREICEYYQERDPRVKAFSKENGGVSTARNLGILRASGEYLVFVDCDDTLAEGCLALFHSIVEEHHPEMVLTGIQVVVDQKITSVKKSLLTGLHGVNIWDEICRNSDYYGYLLGKVYRRSVIEKNHICFDTEMRSQEDLNFNAEMYHYSNNFYLTDQAGYLYYYTVSSRKPQYADYINNQIKLFRYSSKVTALRPETQKAMMMRVEDFVYSYLYHAGTKVNTKAAIDRMLEIDGLRDFLNEHFQMANRKWLMRQVIHNNASNIWAYFHIRNIVRNMVRKIRGRKT